MNSITNRVHHSFTTTTTVLKQRLYSIYSRQMEDELCIVVASFHAIRRPPIADSRDYTTHTACQLCSGPRCLPGRRCVHDNTHFTNGCELLRHPTPDTEHPEVAASSCCYVAGHQPCADEAGLLQLGASWPSSEPPEPASGCHQRSSQADLLS